MEVFETTLTGSDGNISGVVTQISKDAYQFNSLDDALHLTIAKNNEGKWVRLSGSEPYFSGWVDELSEHIAAHTQNTIKPRVARKAVAPVEKKTVEVTKEPTKTKAPSSATKTRPAATPAVKKSAVKAESDKKITAKTAPVKKAKVSSATTKK